MCRIKLHCEASPELRGINLGIDIKCVRKYNTWRNSQNCDNREVSLADSVRLMEFFWTHVERGNRDIPVRRREYCHSSSRHFYSWAVEFIDCGKWEWWEHEYIIVWRWATLTILCSVCVDCWSSSTGCTRILEFGCQLQQTPFEKILSQFLFVSDFWRGDDWCDQTFKKNHFKSHS